MNEGLIPRQSVIRITRFKEEKKNRIFIKTKAKQQNEATHKNHRIEKSDTDEGVVNEKKTF